jgi:hypothetical protein
MYMLDNFRVSTMFSTIDRMSMVPVVLGRCKVSSERRVRSRSFGWYDRGCSRHRRNGGRLHLHLAARLHLAQVAAAAVAAQAAAIAAAVAAATAAPVPAAHAVWTSRHMLDMQAGRKRGRTGVAPGLARAGAARA